RISSCSWVSVKSRAMVQYLSGCQPDAGPAVGQNSLAAIGLRFHLEGGDAGPGVDGDYLSIARDRVARLQGLAEAAFEAAQPRAPPRPARDRLGEDAQLEQPMSDGSGQPDRAREIRVDVDGVVIARSLGVGVDLCLCHAALQRRHLVADGDRSQRRRGHAAAPRTIIIERPRQTTAWSA